MLNNAKEASVLRAVLDCNPKSKFVYEYLTTLHDKVLFNIGLRDDNWKLIERVVKDEEPGARANFYPPLCENL